MERMYFYQRKLRDVLSERIERNPRYSLRTFAKSLGLDPGTFSQLLSGKRFPSTKVAVKLFQALGLTPEEQNEFLSSLAEAKTKAGLKRISPELRNLLTSKKQRQSPPKELTFDVLRIISEWHHTAILELPFTKDFQSDPRWIAESLGISVAETHSAIQRLLDLGLLELEDGKLKRVDAQMMSVDRHLTTVALRKRQKQVLEKSIHSLETDPIEERNHTAMTFAIASSKIPEAKKRIEKFMHEMTQFLESGERDRVFEMTVNLFPIQKKSTLKGKTV